MRKGNNLGAFSVDVKYLYYSLVVKYLYYTHSYVDIYYTHSYVDKFGVVAFENKSGISSSGFLKLLGFYFRTTFNQGKGEPYLQKQDMCIGSCIVLVLGDLVLAQLDTTPSSQIQESKVKKVFRFIETFHSFYRFRCQRF